MTTTASSGRAGESYEEWQGPREDRKQRFELVRFSDLQASTSSAGLISRLIPRVGLTVVWGPPKSGKSFWVMDAMLHVALGWLYRGRKVYSGPVVYCAFEGIEGYGKRAAAFREHHQSDGVLDPPFYLVPARMNFGTEHTELIAAISATLGNQRPVAVVLDTLNRSLYGSESNDQDMAAYVKAADTVREKFACAVIVVHHCGIDGTRPRGHSSLTGAVDAQLVCRRGAGDTILIKVEWMKDGPEGDTIASQLVPVEVGVADDGETITSCVVVPADASALNCRTQNATRLKRPVQIALDALHEALAECGTVQPASPHIPQGIQVVTVDQWRQLAYRKGISTSAAPRAKQQAFKRASDELIGDKHVAFWDDYVWPCR